MGMPREVARNIISGGRGPGNRKRRRDMTKNIKLRAREHPPCGYKRTLTVEFGTLTVTIRLLDRSTATPTQLARSM